MKKQPSEHAMWAANAIYQALDDFNIHKNLQEDATLIDTHAIEPATRELREVLAETDEILTAMGWNTRHGLVQRIRAVLAKYEGGKAP